MDDEPKKIIRKLLRLKINSYWQNQIIFEWTTNRRRFLENFIASTAIIPGQIRQFLNGRRTEEDQENYLGSKSTVTGKIRSYLNGQPTEEDLENYLGSQPKKIQKISQPQQQQFLAKLDNF
eukprot:TRINITY_DN2878_c0_g1_i18.p1 TRINITY_DN2878_c0_g1~~TRINITY_DN2878_c0_g1_i18.p1  ORF type:complete len:121 (+),score=4.00 TRINITY_DN2878_c0_g1_i18:122-484(+)